MDENKPAQSGWSEEERTVNVDIVTEMFSDGLVSGREYHAIFELLEKNETFAADLGLTILIADTMYKLGARDTPDLFCSWMEKIRAADEKLALFVQDHIILNTQP